MEWNNEHKRGCKTAHGERHKMMDIHCSQPVHFQRQMQIIAFSFIGHCRLLTNILLSSLKSKFSTEKCLCENNVNPIETAKCTLIYITRHGQMIILLLPTEDSIHTEIANRSKSLPHRKMLMWNCSRDSIETAQCTVIYATRHIVLL